MENNFKKNRLSLQKRIARIMVDSNFRNDCYNYRNLELFKYLDLIEKVAMLDISKINHDESILKMDLTQQAVIDEVYSFYSALDEICPDIPLLPIAQKNMQYLTFKPNYSRLKPGETPRSACGYHSEVLPNGKEETIKEIFVYLDGDFRAIFSGPHEFAHSMSERFLNLKRFKSNAVAELIPSIVDVLAPELYLQQHPEHKQQIAALKKASLINNVKKARQTLLEACVIKVMTGEMQYADVVKKYPNLFSEGMIADCVSDIEKGLFKPLHEAQYVLPHVMAETVLEMFKHNPEETTKNIKTTLTCDTEISLEQAYSMLKLPSIETTISTFNSKLNGQALTK